MKWLPGWRGCQSWPYPPEVVFSFLSVRKNQPTRTTAANMNRGAWLLTEEITECYRDIDELLIIGGVVWGDNPEDDFYVNSHGVKTPDAFWKVIVRNDRVIAWIVPNSSTATRKRLDDYLVSVDEIERISGESIPVADSLKQET